MGQKPSIPTDRDHRDELDSSVSRNRAHRDKIENNEIINTKVPNIYVNNKHRITKNEKN